VSQRALVADDDALSREFLAEALESSGYSVRAVADGAAALAALKADDYDLVVTDLRMPGCDGIEVLRASRQASPARPVVVLTAFGAIETAVEAMREGAADFVLKPISPDALEVVLKRIQGTARLTREISALKASLAPAPDRVTGILGSNPRILEAVELARRVAPTPATVLIRGDSGTGKELIAALVHEESPRAERPFIRVNCAALTETLLTSELFGHEKGAFTGAHQKKEGRFELAHGGTLFLDEIGEIAPEVQSKLLRVLELGEFERVGGTRTLKVDVRVVAATNRDLEAAIASGRFREDLFFRLNVFPISLPPLAERREDVIVLAAHFLERFRKELGGAARAFDRSAAAALEAYDWPGNVRELMNVVQRGILRASGPSITSRDLGLEPAAAAARPANVPVGLSIDEAERHLILRTLDLTSWNRTEASRILGVTTRTLCNKLRLYRSQGLVGKPAVTQQGGG
jgi:DNA-binding NtrC family response regulator